MTFNEFAVDHAGMAGSQPWLHAKALLDAAHIILYMVIDLETIGFKVGNPGFAAATIGIAVYVNGQLLSCLCQRGQ